MEGRLSGSQRGRTILQRVDQKLEACFHVRLRLAIPCTTSPASSGVHALSLRLEAALSIDIRSTRVIVTVAAIYSLVGFAEWFTTRATCHVFSRISLTNKI